MHNGLKLAGNSSLKIFGVSVSAAWPIIFGSVMIVIVIVRILLPLIDDDFGCAFAKSVILDPWTWFFLITGLTATGFALLRQTINRPEGYPRSTSFFFWLLSPREIGEEAFMGELLWILFGLFLLVLMWFFDRLC